MSGRKGPNIVEALRLAVAAVHGEANGVETLEDVPTLERERLEAAGYVATFPGECTVRFMLLPFGRGGRARWYVLAERGPDVVATPCSPETAADLELLTAED